MRNRTPRTAWAVACALVTIASCGRPKAPNEGPKEEGPPSASSARFASDPNGLLTGTLSKSLNGGTIGEYTYRTDHGPSESRLLQNYKPEEGLKLKVVGAQSTPGAVEPGQEVALDVTYAVLGPDGQKEAEVVEVRRVTLDGVKVAELRASVVRGVGTHTSRVQITLPRAASRGSYGVLFIVATGGKSGSGKAEFTVK